jgi:hypothetical protein
VKVVQRRGHLVESGGLAAPREEGPRPVEMPARLRVEELVAPAQAIDLQLQVGEVGQ